ncbi:MAG: metallophosphoesterase family protein [Desulfobacterales bacterium]|nr:metallophosphoesterase family protein [Desulfobacterales bacterium]
MEILLLSDIHGHTQHFSALSPVMEEVDLICLCGDLTSFQGPAAALQVVQALKQPMEKIVAVSGNCDNKGVETALTKQGIGIDGRRVTIKEIDLFGLGGSLTTPFATPNEFSDRHFKTELQKATKKGENKNPLVLLSHQPPFKSGADRLSSGLHSGSKALTDFIDSHMPLACLTGHIHESRIAKMMGETLIVNPGSFAQGHWARVHITPTKAQAELHTL